MTINGKQFKWSAAGVMAVVIFIVGWMFLIERRVSQIEASRFTNQDAVGLQRRLDEQLLEIREQLLLLRVEIREGVLGPPTTQ